MSLGKVVILSYLPQPCGRSYYRVRCECGRTVDVYAWRGEKKCDCGKILSIKFSPEGREVIASDSEKRTVPVSQIEVTAPCVNCSSLLLYVHGKGWSHADGKERDHPALPVSDQIQRRPKGGEYGTASGS